MAKAQMDKFANQAVIACTETAINTLTFKKLETGISLFEKVAWIIHRVEYFLGPTAPILANANDAIQWALTTTDQLSSIAISNAAVLDILKLEYISLGAAASGLYVSMPIVKDFAQLPSGGLIVPPNPLYLAVQGIVANAVGTVTAKIFYTNLQMSVEDYWELVEARRIISS